MNSKKLLIFIALISFSQTNLSMETTKNLVGQLFTRNSAQYASICLATLITKEIILQSWQDKLYNLFTFKRVAQEVFNNIGPELVATLAITCANGLGSAPQLDISELKKPALVVATVSGLAALYSWKKTKTTYEILSIKKTAFYHATTTARQYIALGALIGLPLHILAQRYNWYGKLF